jgi:putative multiple sugar transport system substrate-binding protein
MTGILDKYGSQRVDAVLSPYDGISRGVLAALHSDGYGTAARPLPIVTGQDAELESVKSIIAGQQAQTVYKDVRQLADAAVTVVDDILNDRMPWVDNSVGYKNGVKAVPAVLLQPTSVDKSNYDVLILDEYLTEEELK